MNVSVVTIDGCTQCDFTKRKLKEVNVNYNEINVTEDEKTKELLRRCGLSAMPVVMWSGFQLDQIRALGRATAPPADGLAPHAEPLP